MGILNITKADILKFKALPAGWFVVQVNGYNQKPDKDGAALHQFSGVILEGPHKDQPIPMEPPGNIQFSEKAPSMATNFIEACAGSKVVGEEGGAFEMQDCVGKTIKAKNEPKLYNGRQQNNWMDFMPNS